MFTNKPFRKEPKEEGNKEDAHGPLAHIRLGLPRPRLLRLRTSLCFFFLSGSLCCYGVVGLRSMPGPLRVVGPDDRKRGTNRNSSPEQ
jgi:hypothetical protein